MAVGSGEAGVMGWVQWKEERKSKRKFQHPGQRLREGYTGVHVNDIGCKHVGSKRPAAMSSKQPAVEVSARDRLNKRMPPKQELDFVTMKSLVNLKDQQMVNMKKLM